MKRVLLLIVAVLVVCSPLAVSYAEEEIFWRGITPDEPTITDKDFRLDFNVPAAKSLGDLEIYDQPKDIFEEDEAAEVAESNVPAAPPAPIQPRTVTRPPTDVAPAPRVTPRASEIIPGQGEIGPRTPESATRRRQRSPSTQVQQSDTSTPASDELDRTGQKKMKWGQVDVQPAEPKGKFQWGQR